MSNKEESDFEKKIDKDNIKVTPFGTSKKKKNVPDQDPQEEYLSPKSKNNQKEK
ncbi:hypothetical protein [Algoriphagus sp. NG3]|uniref:hypothetical protein n=1 Tax=unclassified Algoriphagus TaxID=2641541 RepID=UPI002A829D6D|nr:hypothetical protein [Algoriphagus sp. NG3]WPR75973.1 hypothetical protein SLW71_01245 [Algoriphagus sp. NG3]